MTSGYTHEDRTSQSFSNDQVIYKLGQIETQIRGIDEGLKDVVKRLEDKIIEAGNRHVGAVSILEKEQLLQEKKHEDLEKRFKKFETWKDQITFKLGFGVSGLTVFWLVFGDVIKEHLGGFVG